MAGWIKIHREIKDHWIFQDAEKFRWWIDMLFLASYEDNRMLIKNQLVEIKRGQFIGSISFFTKRWNASKDRVINFLKLLHSNGMIDKKSDKNITIITICNYDYYQDVPDNLPDNIFRYKADNLPDNLPDTTKEGKEVKEIINIQAAHAREESPSWTASVEQGYLATFKGLGAAMPMSRKTGIPADEIMKLLDCYMADRELKGRGHKDYNEFRNLFLWHVENGKITLPRQQERKPKVIAGADILKIYG